MGSTCSYTYTHMSTCLRCSFFSSWTSPLFLPSQSSPKLSDTCVLPLTSRSIATVGFYVPLSQTLGGSQTLFWMLCHKILNILQWNLKWRTLENTISPRFPPGIVGASKQRG